MKKLTKHFRLGRTPQQRPLDPTQVRDSAGGYVWEVTPWQQLDRFLILGSEGGTYYASERALTIDNAELVLELLREDGVRVVERLTEISVQGRAYKQDPTLFVLALAFAAGDEAAKRVAASALPRVARTGGMLFTFLEVANGLRGWGRALRRAVADWYDRRELRELAYQTTKYAARGGWTHRDALRLAHPKASDPERDALYGYLAGKPAKLEALGAGAGDWAAYLRDVDRVRAAGDVQAVIEAVRRHDLPREAVPTERLRDARVWEALLERMPMTAMIRNLATMTRVGLLRPLSPAAAAIAERLTDGERLRRARIHPLQVLAALVTYRSGQGARGMGTWEPVASVIDALDAAFYQSFDHAPTSGKRVLLALDVSGSMGYGSVAGVPGLTPRVASAALALVTAATEPRHAFMAFSHEPMALDISPRQRLDDVVQAVSGLRFGATDCALPMRWALARRLEVDAFVVLTDNETWFGDMHPAEALRDYRRRTGIAARLAVVGMTATNFSIADPQDGGMLDVVGFGTDTPRVIADFLRG